MYVLTAEKKTLKIQSMILLSMIHYSVQLVQNNNGL